MSIPADLAASRHSSVTTYRRDGTSVATPVWHVVHEANLLVWTDPHSGRSGKVKRLRHTNRVTVSASDGRGRVPHSAQRYAGAARILGSADSRAARRMLARRYVLVRLTDLLTRLVPRVTRPGIALVITLIRPPETTTISLRRSGTDHWFA